MPSYPAKRLSAFRSHLIIQYESAPSEDALAALRETGAKILGYVPDYGLSITVDDFASLDVAGLHWAGRVPWDEKISQAISLDARGPDWAYYLIEFHPDVEPGDARLIANFERLAIREHPDLLASHLLVHASASQLLSLAEWDEVSYIFPASEDLINGVRSFVCAGALTAQGPIGQSIPKIGEGWDGPGLGAADLSYYFSHVTRRLASGSTESEIVRAYSEWAKYARLTFSRGTAANSPRTLNVLFASGQHGDPYPFDGPGGVVAHTFFPFPMDPEPIAGDMHFDDSESWNIGVDPDVFSVALHEAGHALGLGHSDIPGTVMYPYYKRVTGLTGEDVGAILDLYAPQLAPSTGGGFVLPPVNPPSVKPTPPSDPPPSPPAPPTSPDHTAPSLTILMPTSTNVYTSANTIVMNGTSSDNVGVIAVTWSSSTGAGGAAAGTQSWTTGPISLYVGTNTITIRASDAAGNAGWRAITVTRN